MLVLLVGVLRLLLVLLVLRLIGRFVAAAVRGYRGAPAGPRLASRDLVRDRVCNTFIPRDRALVASVSGREEHFCSVACRDRALAGGAAGALGHG